MPRYVLKHSSNVPRGGRGYTRTNRSHRNSQRGTHTYRHTHIYTEVLGSHI